MTEESQPKINADEVIARIAAAPPGQPIELSDAEADAVHEKFGLKRLTQAEIHANEARVNREAQERKIPLIDLLRTLGDEQLQRFELELTTAPDDYLYWGNKPLVVRPIIQQLLQERQKPSNS